MTKKNRSKSQAQNEENENSKRTLKGEKDNSDQIELKAKVRRLKIENFGCISTEIVIELDDIVVLVGPNNSGKSTILRAYEIVMGSDNDRKLTKEDFYEGDESRFPCITLETQVQSGKEPGDVWLNPNEKGTIRERWIWDVSREKLVRQGFNFAENKYVKEVPYGAPGVANWHRPKPHRLGAFDQPAERTKKITKLLMDILAEKIKEYMEPSRNKPSDSSDSNLLHILQTISDRVKQQAQAEISKITNHLTSEIAQIFPNHKVDFNPQTVPTDELVNGFISKIFELDSKLKLGPDSSYQSSVEKQGNGAQRMLMWAVIRYLAENDKKVKEGESGRSHILLLDEPELCLHPSAIRDVTRILYELPENGIWQVMISTHSPVFLDLTRDNTTIVRVERSKNNVIGSTTVFRRTKTGQSDEKIKLDSRSREELKLLNICDPYFAEFLFGGQTIIVEGDTEYAAFRYVMSNEPKNERYRALHIVRARGKFSICLVIKLLNRFNSNYSVLHDSDSHKKGGNLFNANKRILASVRDSGLEKRPYLVACITNFEKAIFNQEAPTEESKPFFALRKMKDQAIFSKVKSLLDSLIDQDATGLPENCISWSHLSQLSEQIKLAGDSLNQQISIPGISDSRA